jgi:uncharacterized membrane protein
MQRLRFRLTQVGYDVGSNLLATPLLMAAALGALALGVERLEAALGVRSWDSLEPGTAQVTLATLAGSMMTVVSVVYSVLLVALSLASVQFSTRILANLVRDRVSQAVLGLFLGTFTWQLVALRSIHLDPPFVPPATVGIALLMAVLSLGALVLFIDRVIHAIQANHLVARIAEATEWILDEVFPADGPRRDTVWADVPDGARIVRSTMSGYVQLVAVGDVRALAARGLRIHLLRPVGAFVPAGAGLWAVDGALTAADEEALRRAVDLGPIRTMQQDAEWGLRQIVDIGLKAISPAVNDPSTAATCIDHLSRLLIRAGTRGAPESREQVGAGELAVPWPRYSDLVDLAFEQLRQYGRADMAIQLRLLRAIVDVAEVVAQPEGRARLAVHARQVHAAATAAFSPEDREELDRRYEKARRLLG